MKKQLKNKRKYYHFNKNSIIIPAITVAFIITLLVLYIFMEKKHTKNLAMVISKMTEVKDGFNWDQMGEQERRSKYRQMMIRIMTVYGYQYDPAFKKAMSKDEKIKYINLNYEAATKLNLGLFDVPIIHLMETSFNPYAKGEYDERGIGQMKYNTALLAERLVKIMPSDKRKLLDFDIKSKSDLYDPIISTKATYVLLWNLKRDYKGREDWFISAYHWGGFLARRWDDGRGNVPAKFTLNGIEYNVIKYYVAFRELKEAFESGKLEAGKAIEERWARYQKQLIQEEVNFRRTRAIIRNLRKQLAEKRELEDELHKKHEEINMALDVANNQLQQISKGSQKDGKKSLNKIKTVVKDLLQIIKKIN